MKKEFCKQKGENVFANYDNSLPYRTKQCRTKVTKFFVGDENFVRQIILSDENFGQRNIFSGEKFCPKPNFQIMSEFNKYLFIARILDS